VPKKNQMKDSLWSELINNYKEFDLNNFRSIGGLNERLGTWSARDNSTRYYKALMYEFANYLDTETDNSNSPIPNQGILSKYYTKISNQNLGNPTTINYRGMQISMDYLLSIEETKFLNIYLNRISNICEIGAGFGRTAHAIISNCNTIKKYYIIDLPEMLNLCKAYLKKVLRKKDFDKICFLKPNEKKIINKIDLFINIDSFQEMPKNIALEYLHWISSFKTFFFTKNAMGKYRPEEINLEIENKSEYKSVIKMGLITKEYKIFDDDERLLAEKEYLKIFCPKNFSLLKTSRGFGQYLSYQLALYKSN
tara:strand:+ start:855 stop:1781 length:927 start_codon:yes stop_codon:yes gene_type:complete